MDVLRRRLSERRLLEAPEGLERNRMARDSFSYLRPGVRARLRHEVGQH